MTADQKLAFKEDQDEIKKFRDEDDKKFMDRLKKLRDASNWSTKTPEEKAAFMKKVYDQRDIFIAARSTMRAANDDEKKTSGFYSLSKTDREVMQAKFKTAK